MRRLCLPVALVLACPLSAAAQPRLTLPGPPDPVLRVRAGGPTAFVTALAFSPDGATLYAAGFDKVVHTWTADGAAFVPGTKTYRVPIGPGDEGMLNALAVSPDGRWLAVGGKGVMRGSAGFGDPGLLVPTAGRLTDDMLRDQGTICVFDTREDRFARALRGHRGIVQALTFAPGGKAGLARLVSVAREWDDGAFVGRARVWEWDATTEPGEERRKTSPVLPDPGNGQRPGLTAWLGPRLRVALALNDADDRGRHLLRVWDTDPNTVHATDARGNPLFDGAANDTVVYLAEAKAGRLVTGSNRFAQSGAGRVAAAHLQAWTVTPGSAPRPGPVAALLPEQVGFPQAVAVVPGVGGSAPLLAVTVLVRPDPQDATRDEYRLLLVSAAKEAKGKKGQAVFGEVLANELLWTGGPLAKPALAVSAAGRRIAVAGARDRAVRLYRVEAGPRLRREAPLTPLGVDLGAVAFVRKGADRGLKLTDAAEPDRPLIADLVGGRPLRADAAGWRNDVPDLAGWGVDLAGGRPATFVVRRDGREVGRVRLRPGQAPTAYALLPTRRAAAAALGGAAAALGHPALRVPAAEPLLAVAYVEAGVPCLGLYSAETGSQLRQYTGHLDRIEHLAFAADGRLLASAGRDQTVCIWSLTDLEPTLGRRAALHGLALGIQGGRLVLARLTEDALSPANRAALTDAGVAPGAALERLTVGGVEVPLPREPADFYLALGDPPPGTSTPPGTPVVLRLGGQDVRLIADQAIDERKPLLSLFVSAPLDGRRQWIGWSPAGPYDAGDPDAAEPFIGWHRNTGRPDDPVSFSGAGKYRKDYFRPGFLKLLLEHGSFLKADQARAFKPAPPSEQAVAVEDAGGGRDVFRFGENTALVRRKPQKVMATVKGLAPDQIEWVRWQIDDAPPRDFPRATHTLTPDSQLLATYEADIPPDYPGPDRWRRGRHELRLIVRPKEPGADSGTRDRTATLPLYFAPRPTVVTPADWNSPAKVDRPDHAVAATVVLGEGLAPGDVRVTLLHNGKEVPLAAEDLTEAHEDSRLLLRLNRTVRLTPGGNQLQVRAQVRAPAFPDHDDLERDASAVRAVELKVPPAPEPVIVLNEVAAAGQTQAPAQGVATVVRVRQVRVRGTVTARTPLLDVRLDGERLPGLVSGSREFAIDHVVALPPGQAWKPVELTFTARAKDAEKEGRRVLTLRYEPQLPAFTFRAVGKMAATDEPQEIELGRHDERPDDHPFAVRVSVNGVEVPELSRLRAGAAAGCAAVPLPLPLVIRPVLKPGDNSVVVVTANEREQQRREHRLYRLRPPLLVSVDHPARVRQAAVDLVAQVESAADLPPPSVRLEGAASGGPKPLPAERGGRPGGWSVKVPGVVLTEGPNRLRLWATNQDGESAEPREIVIHFEPVRPPPVVHLQGVRDDGAATTDQPVFPLRFRLSSTTELKELLIRRDTRVVVTKAELEKSAQPLPDGSVEYRANVPLVPGPNRLSIEAVNAGGAPKEPVGCTVSFTRRTKRFVAERLEVFSRPGAGAKYPARERADGSFEFPEVPSGAVRVYGKLLLADPADPDRAAAVHVPVKVNKDFVQLDAEVEPAEAGQTYRRVWADVLLPSPANEVELDFGQLNLEGDARRVVCHVRCTQPVARQRLHLLVVAPGHADGAALRDRVIRAFQAREVSRDPLSGAFKIAAPAFSEGWVYEPLPPNLTPLMVLQQLVMIKEYIKNSTRGAGRAGREQPHGDVVVVFFEGDEELRGDELVLKTRARGARRDLRFQEMRQALADAPGAKLLLLNVRRTGAPPEIRPAPLRAAEPDRVAVFHFAKDPDAPEEAHLLALLERLLSRSFTLGKIGKEAGKELGVWLPRDAARMATTYNNVAPDLALGGPPGGGGR